MVTEKNIRFANPNQVRNMPINFNILTETLKSSNAPENDTKKEIITEH